MAMIGNSGFMAKKAGPLTYGRIVGIILGVAVGLLIMVFVGGNILGWMFAAVLLFFIPHLFGAGPKEKVAYGIAFFAAALVLGGAVINPGILNNMNDTDTGEGGQFDSVSIDFDRDTSELLIEAGLKDEITDHLQVRAYICEVSIIVFRGVYLTKTVEDSPYTELDGEGRGSYVIDSSNLYCVILREYTDQRSDGTPDTDGEGNPVWTLVKGSDSNILYTGAFLTGSTAHLCWFGAAFGLAYTMAIFFFIVLVTWFLRHRLSKTRKKMEEQGRLYPQGYGRCTFCGGVVLPGEVKCRKCGAYIDRPESMKKPKNDRFLCTDCGAEVPADATECPKCGAKFDGVENEIRHTDGTVDVSTENIVCPYCGTEIPKNAVYCPKCLKKLKR